MGNKRNTKGQHRPQNAKKTLNVKKANKSKESLMLAISQYILVSNVNRTVDSIFNDLINNEFIHIKDKNKTTFMNEKRVYYESLITQITQGGEIAIDTDNVDVAPVENLDLAVPGSSGVEVEPSSSAGNSSNNVSQDIDPPHETAPQSLELESTSPEVAENGNVTLGADAPSPKKLSIAQLGKVKRAELRQYDTPAPILPSKLAHHAEQRAKEQRKLKKSQEKVEKLQMQKAKQQEKMKEKNETQNKKGTKKVNKKHLPATSNTYRITNYFQTVPKPNSDTFSSQPTLSKPSSPKTTSSSQPNISTPSLCPNTLSLPSSIPSKTDSTPPPPLAVDRPSRPASKDTSKRRRDHSPPSRENRRQVPTFASKCQESAIRDETNESASPKIVKKRKGRDVTEDDVIHPKVPRIAKEPNLREAVTRDPTDNVRLQYRMENRGPLPEPTCAANNALIDKERFNELNLTGICPLPDCEGISKPIWKGHGGTKGFYLVMKCSVRKCGHEVSLKL